MTVLTFMTQKGGVGKSMLTALIAGTLCEMGGTVHIIDGDPQGSLSRWKMRCLAKGHALANITVETLADESLLADRLEAMSDFDGTVLIDTKGAMTEFATVAAYLSDLVIMPSKISINDLEPAVDISKHLRNVGVSTELRLVLNDVDNLYKHSSSFKETLVYLDDAKLEYFDTMIFHRPTYVSVMNGDGLISNVKTSPEAITKAKANIISLFGDITKVLNRDPAT